MLFNSLHFLIFFPVVCILYYVLPSVKTRNTFLLIASYYFYMNWEPIYALLLLSSTVITYLAALGIASQHDKKRKQLFLTISLILNLGILFLFKYYNFAADNITTLMTKAGLELAMPHFTLLLPVGISFYIFQALGYSIDVYRGNTPAEHNFFTYALFVSFFPQLVAGPIERSTNLLPQFKKLHKFSYDNFITGIKWMVWGYFLKLVLADRCGIYVDAIFNNLEHHNGGSYLLASLLFPFQIYGDFAGYSLTAIGAAKVMGFNLMENFRRPYFSTTVTEFWHRWHISLSTWFKDYVYIPLGGNRVSKSRRHLNVMTTFMVSGIWHGANWTFLAWGTIHGALQCTEKALGWDKADWKGSQKFFHWLLTFVIVCLAWIFFRSNSIGDAFHIFNGIFTNLGMPFLKIADLMAVALALFIVLVKEIREERRVRVNRVNKDKMTSRTSILEWLGTQFYIVTLVAFIVLFGVLNGDQFIYFQF